MKVKDLCQPEVVTVASDTAVVDAARLMRERHIGYLIVVDRTDAAAKAPVGVLTDRDIVVEAVAQSVDPGRLLVGDIMSRRPVVIGEDVDLSLALERMRITGVRRLPVVDQGGALAGVLSLDQVIEALSADMHNVAASLRNEQRIERALRR